MGALAADSWQRKEPTTFIYGDPPDACSVPFLGTYCSPPPSCNAATAAATAAAGIISPPYSMPDPRARYAAEPEFAPASPRCPRRRGGTFTYYSSAPLRAVAAAEVFYRRVSIRVPLPDSSALDSPLPRPHAFVSTCQGIILHYENGGSRALGNVQVGVDPSCTVVKPTHVCIAYACFRRKYLVLELRSDPQHVLFPSEGVIFSSCRRLKGVLQYWFNDDDAYALVVDDSSA